MKIIFVLIAIFCVYKFSKPIYRKFIEGRKYLNKINHVLDKSKVSKSFYSISHELIVKNISSNIYWDFVISKYIKHFSSISGNIRNRFLRRYLFSIGYSVLETTKNLREIKFEDGSDAGQYVLYLIDETINVLKVLRSNTDLLAKAYEDYKRLCSSAYKSELSQDFYMVDEVESI